MDFDISGVFYGIFFQHNDLDLAFAYYFHTMTKFDFFPTTKIQKGFC